MPLVIKSQRGFTLIELLFVIVIMGIIAAVAIPRMGTTSDTAKEAANAQNISIIQKQVERWYVERGVFPDADLSDLGADTDFFPNGLPVNPFEDERVYQLDEVHSVILSEPILGL